MFDGGVEAGGHFRRWASATVQAHGLAIQSGKAIVAGGPVDGHLFEQRKSY